MTDADPLAPTLPPHLLALRVHPASAGVRHDPALLAPSTDEASPPDLFRLTPAAVRRAFDLGVLASDPSFHVYVEVPDDVDARQAVVDRARARLAGRGEPLDVVYVHDFDRPAAPLPLVLPAGLATVLADDMDELLAALQERLPELEQAPRWRDTRASTSKRLKEHQRVVFTELEGLAKKLSFGLKLQGNTVQTFAILHGKPVSAEQFEVLDEGTRKTLTEAEEKLAHAIEQAAGKISEEAQEAEEEEAQVHEDLAREMVDELAGPMLERFGEFPEVRTWLERALQELVDDTPELLAMLAPRQGPESDKPEAGDPEIATSLDRYSVNVFLTHHREVADTPLNPPVVIEDNPTLQRLFGFLERRVEQGALVTDFMRIRAGSLHRASGGVLVVRATDLLNEANAWTRLKRALRARAVGYEDPVGPMGLYATTLRPRACPIRTRVVLLGNHSLYAMLLEADPDFAALFRVKVEFPGDLQRNEGNTRLLDEHIVRLCRSRGWGPLDAGARARALDYACRLAEDTRRYTLALQPVEDALAFATVMAQERREQREDEPEREVRHSLPPPPTPEAVAQAHAQAVEDERPLVTAKDMDDAWQERRERTAGAERELRDMVLADEVLLATDGEHVGVVNGLSVLSAGDVQFGHPVRITAVVSLGMEGLIDVEREASLGGALHTKGVAILRGFLSNTFGQERPVALRAQIAFEQSYGEIDGDSASSTELYAVLSALAELPVRQDIAITGSVNQLGEVQAIGGVTAKIEGFFDLCAARGLTGRQGVLIPRSCVSQLVLRDDVVDAVEQGRFHLFAVRHVTEGVEVLMGVPAGQRDGNGRFAAHSVFGRVERRLIEIAERLRKAAGGGGDGGDGGDGMEEMGTE